VPVAIYNLRLGENEIKSLKYLFVGCAVVQSVYALFFLFNHPGALQLYSLGRVLPTIEINHVEISWLISIGVLLLLDNYKNISVVPEKLIVGLIVIWLFFFLHLFAVRTGLLCVYLFLSIFFIVEIEKNKKLRKYFILLPTVVALSFFLSYKLSDSIRYKLDYTRYDINRFQGGASDFQLYSDGRRLQSIKIGLMLIREYPWLGCGIGNIKDKCDEIYKTNYPGISPENYYRPHSLYVYITCCFGFIIGGFLIFCFIYPLIYFLQKKNYLFFNLYSSFIIVSVWDVVMGTLFGECLYLLVIGWGLKMDVHENITPQQQ
jgi:O-antigen ligase